MPKEQTIVFQSAPYRLVGTLHIPDLPDRRPAPVVIGCHGLLSDRHSPKQVALAESCVRRGIAYFRFDHQGCGESQGDLARGAALDARCRDLAGAAAALAEQPRLGPLLGLFGSSYGGTVALAYAGKRCTARLVTYAAPCTSQGLGADRIVTRLSPAQTAILAKSWDFDIRSGLAGLHHLLVFHCAADAVVPVAHAREIHRRAHEPKRLIIFEGGDHPMSDPHLQTRFLSQAADWFQKGFTQDE